MLITSLHLVIPHVKHPCPHGALAFIPLSSVVDSHDVVSYNEKMQYAKWILSGMVISLFFVAHNRPARAEEFIGCQQNMPLEYAAVPDSIFENYESIEYLNGRLVIHFRFNREFTIDEEWLPGVQIIDDQCRSTVVMAGSPFNRAIIPSRNISLRFTDTSYQFWNDDTNTKIPCDIQCEQRLSSVPDFLTVRLVNKAYHRGEIMGDMLSSAHHIKENPTRHPPISTATLPKPDMCHGFDDHGIAIVDQYEHAEYVNGFLQIHFRRNFAARDLSFGEWAQVFLLRDSSCIQRAQTVWNPLPIRPFLEYFSIRFTSPTHYVWWDDDFDTAMTCAKCSGDLLPATLPDGSRPSYVTVETNAFDATPHPIVEPTPGHSSVIFLPGLEASRLYRQDTFFENQLWDPNRHQDTQDLYLDQNGVSIFPNIYTRDIVDTVDLSSQNIYKSFINMMDGLVADQTIKEWKPLPYDWRFDYDAVINSADMLAEVERMATSSDTGQVTLIAHSNGGLIAKQLITRLEQIGKADLIDKLILVAVPQMGTPKAMEALLHGESTSWLKSLFLPRWLTRGLAEHMQSAFNLLPTEAYFEKVTAPVVEFDPKAESTANLRSVYGNSITTAQEMRDFLKGIDGRTEPAERDTNSPNVLLSSFIGRSAIRASEQDAWISPADLEIIQIAGWGLETLKGIKYKDRINPVCNADFTRCENKKVIDQRPLTTTDGDKTVISYSADGMEEKRYYVDLRQYNKLGNFRINRDHGDILEVSEILPTISNLIRNQDITLNSIIKIVKPIDPVLKHRLSVHSPVSIDVYDSLGNHTGLKANPDPDSDIQLLEEQIPNSAYYEFGEGKYISVPEGETYNTIIKGIGLGEFDLELDDNVLYADIPVNSNTIATITISDTTIPVLALDVDGNGVVDANIPQGYTLSASSLLDILEYNIKQFALSPKLQKKFDKKIILIRGSVTKKQITNAQKRLDSLAKDIRTYVSRGYITFEQGKVLMGLIQKIKTALK